MELIHTCDIGVPDRNHPLSTDMAHCGGCNPGRHGTSYVPATLYSPPGENGPGISPGFIADTPENRQLLEKAAIPRCAQWREAHPEYDESLDVVLPAPYCCSAYCDRCCGLRALDGAEPLLPNDWMR